MSHLFTPHEFALISDQEFFRTKARIGKTVRDILEEIHDELREELSEKKLITPEGFDREKFQFVKGEHLEDYPYQYLDFPKHFVLGDKCTFRSMFWWGHHFVFALIVEGSEIPQYKKNFFDRYHALAGNQLALCLSPSLWEWKRGEGLTLPINHENKSKIGAALSGRKAFKIARFLSFDEHPVLEGRVAKVARSSLHALLPLLTP